MTWSPEQSNFPSDHFIVDFEIQQAFHRGNPVTRNIFEYKRGNFDELRNYLTTNPLRSFSSENINECWLQWKLWFLNAVHKFVPVKTVKDATKYFHTKEILC